MTTSKMVAALLGPTLLATAMMVLVNLAAMPKLVEELSQSPMLVVLAGYAAFVPGLAIVYFHNRWTDGWPVLVTMMGWISLVIGLFRLCSRYRSPDGVEAQPRDDRRFSRGRGRLPANRRVPIVQGLQARLSARVGSLAVFELSVALSWSTR